MITRLGSVLVVALALLAVEAPEAKAQCGASGYGGMGFGGYGYDVGRLYGVLAQKVPYYAAFPPVYYSAPVPRTYGYSPFAYPPGTATPELPSQVMAAQEILNPYVPASTVVDKEEADNVTQRTTTPAALAIVNPFLHSQVAEISGPVSHAVMLNR
jgi:hypothetical protein